MGDFTNEKAINLDKNSKLNVRQSCFASLFQSNNYPNFVQMKPRADSVCTSINRFDSITQL
jgi:hypothetical protein